MQENDTRPDPEVLLARLKEEEQEEGGRGKLRIYLGYAAGVGKTYTVLSGTCGKRVILRHDDNQRLFLNRNGGKF